MLLSPYRKSSSFVVHSQRLDGTDRQRIGAIDDDIRCISYDWIGHNIIWSAVGKIGATSVANASVTKTLVTQTYAVSLALDPQNGRMFWCGWHPSAGISDDGTGSIGFAWMDGTNKGSLATDLRFPSSLTIDHDEQRLYWMDLATDRIERIDFDGKNRDVIHVHDARQHLLPFTFVYYARTVFFSNKHFRIIRMYLNETTTSKSYESQ